MAEGRAAVAATETVRGGRRRDAANTRRLLIEAARRRFTHDGYVATTVRDIAEEAGVNVALIHRYFESKEGLFEACLGQAVEALAESGGEVRGLAGVAEAISRQATGAMAAPGAPNALLLLLRSSGDERAEQMRVGVLKGFGERLAAVAGWEHADPGNDGLLLRAQVVLSAGIGIAVLRSSAGLEPLASATAAELADPLSDLVHALLGPDPGLS